MRAAWFAGAAWLFFAIGFAPASATVEEAESAWRLGEHEEAAQIIQGWLAANLGAELAPEALVMLARTATTPEEAIQRWDELLALKSRGELAAEARWSKGMASYSAGLYVAAAREFSTLATDLSRWFDPGKANLWLANSLLGADQPDDAIKAYREAERGANDPVDVAAAELGQAHAHFRAGRIGEALKRYDRFESKHPHDGRSSSAAQKAAECLRLLGREAEAHQRAERIEEEHPNSSEATLVRAKIRTLNDREVKWREGEAGIDEAPIGPFVVQVASFAEVRNAVALKRKINSLGIRDLQLEPGEGPNGPVHRVILGPYDEEAFARSIADSVAALGDLNPRVRHHLQR